MLYRIFTAESGLVSPGAVVARLELKGAGVTIPAILVGERGPGRELGVLPVALLPESLAAWERDGKATVTQARIGSTRAGAPKLLEAAGQPSGDSAVVVLRTKIGFRGSNDHTGDRTGWRCQTYGCRGGGPGEKPAECPECGKRESFVGCCGPATTHAPLPGRVLARGRIADGAAGRMGAGDQLVVLLPRDAVLRTAYSGRLYGSPSTHYLRFDGEKLQALTWQERLAADLW